jgi:alcohol dehydrogenase YqhD (iron-dependent ADH family)
MKKKARECIAALMNYWRSVGLNVTLKAHVIEKHVCELNDSGELNTKKSY